MNTHTMKLQPGPFDKIKEGTKKIELRLYDEKRAQVQIGDTIEFIREPERQETVKTTVIGLLRYNTFEELINDFEPEMFGSTSRGELIEGVHKFYTKEDVDKYGVLGIRIKN